MRRFSGARSCRCCVSLALACGAILLGQVDIALAQSAPANKLPDVWAQFPTPSLLTLPEKPSAAPSKPAGPQKSGATVPVSLQALLSDDGGQRIDQGLVWRVFEGKAGGDGKFKLVTTSRDAAPVLRLAPGEYLINASFGRAHLTHKVVVKPGEAVTEKLVLNAGGLRVTAQLAGGEPAADRSVSYDIFSDQRDQAGNRARIMSGAKPGLIIRLNAGIYHLRSVYGDANAVVAADVTVEAGKLTEATVSHAAAKVAFKLVQRAGGEALADTHWNVLTQTGELIKDSVGALPTHILAAGNYVVTARRGGQTFSREFEVHAGEMSEVEVVAAQ